MLLEFYAWKRFWGHEGTYFLAHTIFISVFLLHFTPLKDGYTGYVCLILSVQNYILEQSHSPSLNSFSPRVKSRYARNTESQERHGGTSSKCSSHLQPFAVQEFLWSQMVLIVLITLSRFPSHVWSVLNRCKLFTFSLICASSAASLVCAEGFLPFLSNHPHLSL